MEYFSIVIRMFFLALSFFGYVRYLNNILKQELVIGWLFASIGSTLFVAGLLNILQEMTWIIFLYGLFLAIKSIISKDSLKNLFKPGTLFFIIATAFFLFLLYGSKFETSDNFSHWANATKVLMDTDLFPNTNSVDWYRYPSYPIGSACFIYYFSEIIGIQSEWLQMWAQAILMTGMISSLFVFVKQKGGIITTIVSIIMLLCSQTAFVDLMVDTLLPVVAISAFCFCIYYREEFPNKLNLILPYTIFLFSIKQSGLIFVLFIVLYTLSLSLRNLASLKCCLCVILLTFITFYLWNKHVDLAFGINISDHNMSLANYEAVLSSKTFDENIYIATEFATRMISDTRIILMILAVSALIFLSAKSQRNRNMTEIIRILCFIPGFYLIYQVGMLAMYLISMPKYEAMYLASYNRYHQTILIFSTGLLVIALLLYQKDNYAYTQSRVSNITTVICAVIIFCNILQPNFNFYERQDKTSSINLQDRARAEALVNEYYIPEHGKCLVLVSDNRVFQFFPYPIKNVQHFYLEFLIGYMLDSSQIKCINVSEIDSLNYDQFDYLILFDETSEGRELFINKFGEAEKEVISLN